MYVNGAQRMHRIRVHKHAKTPSESVINREQNKTNYEYLISLKHKLWIQESSYSNKSVSFILKQHNIIIKNIYCK